ncbi:hypothetical protein PRIPAC_71658 [Pristionchus pacificus]|uniref:B box-type domain-containing protein n=1 Tax=Pristionchus pacificus TaxID=54126 RepID=A0A2A6C7G3_PRIPA|nr:hypothetical protein PRIPAC_71658 [Pristionchus pacificus]|eukprot:PDM74047.1 hypothetical protein PRIPAC_41403 [Pristionchus pacificus]
MFSAARVVGLLSYQLGIDPDIASATREESKLAGVFAHLLREASMDRLVYESKEEATMDDPSDDECADPTWGMEDLDIVNDLPALDRKNFQFSNGFASLETVLEAAAFYRSTVTKPHKNLMAMKSRFRFITNEHDLRKLESFAKDNVENTARRASRVTGLQNLSNHLMEEVMDAFDDGYTLHDFDLTVMALDINREHCYVSVSLIHYSVQEKTTKFVSRVNHVDEQAIKKSADDFVATIKDEMKMRPLSMFANADQSGFLKEMVSKRSLAPIGQRSVVRCVQSKASLTHSYTILPIVYADGSLGETLYINLQEPKGQFPKTKRIFSAPNIYVTCGTTHIMTKNHMREWVNKCIFTASSPSSDLVILLDSWSSFSDTASIDASLPTGKSLTVRQIPKGATGICQPLDVYFFRPFKGLVRRIQSYGFKNCPGFVAHQRDTILKVMSLSYSIMCAPAFRPLIQYAWHAAGYLDTPPTSRFKTPVEVCFPRTVFSAHCQYPNCSSKKSFILCPKCNQILCFTCYVIEVHTC